MADFVRVSAPQDDPAPGEASDGVDAPGARVTFRPRRIRRVCWVLAPLVVVVFTVLGLALSGSTGEGGGAFGTSDRFAMAGLGVLMALAILLFTRPKVSADRTSVQIQNVIGGYDLPWQVVRAVRFERGNPWLTLELHDDDVVAVMAVQAADKEHAVAAARALRALHALNATDPGHPTVAEPGPGSDADRRSDSSRDPG